MSSRGRWIIVATWILLGIGCNGGGGDDDSSTEEATVPPPEATVPPPATYTLSGRVLVPEGTAIDGDTNDPNAVPVIDNSSFATAQPIPNPTNLGGYANVAGAGPEGRSQLTGDPNDFYRIDLARGQTVTLFIGADGEQNDLDLYLLDLQSNEVQASDGTSSVEQLSVTANGAYVIQVKAFTGAATYVLVVSQDIATAAVPDDTAWRPGEVIVQLAPTAPLVIAGASARALAGDLGVRALAGAPERALLVGLEERDPMGVAAVNAAFGREVIDDPGLPNAAMARRYRTLLLRKALARRPDVAHASLNYIRQPSLTPNDPLFPQQWHYNQVRLSQAWELVPAVSDVTVAVVDTGVVADHPDLLGQVLMSEGFDFIQDPDVANDGDGIDADATDSGDSLLLGESSFHGTHVIGTVAAATNNNLQVAGTAFQTKVLPLRAIGVGGGSDYDVGQAILYAARLPNDSGRLPTRRADVINLSLGSTAPSTYLENVVNQAWAAGSVIVAAAGNSNSTVPEYPAAYNGVLSVNAVNISRERAPYSNYGPTIDLAAPGGDMTTDRNGDGFPDGVLSTHIDATGLDRFISRYLQGTSMATAHVSGVIALMRTVYPSLTLSLVELMLVKGEMTVDLGAPGRDDEFGYGLIDGAKAVESALIRAGQPLPDIAELYIDPLSLNLGTNLTEATLTVDKNGTGALAIEAVSDSAPWLAVAPVSVDPEGLGTYAVRVDRTGLTTGVYTGTITIDSTVNLVRVSVFMQVLSADVAADANAGYHYILLVDAATDQTLDQVATAATSGVYPYSFTGVAAGTYRIWAGTDSDNDGFICDLGEACGAYIVLDEPLILTVGSDLSGLDFLTGFYPGLTTAALGQRSVPIAPASPRRISPERRSP